MANRRKASRIERARQFMPFASLRGYYEYILAQAEQSEPRRDPSDDECAELSQKLSRIERGMVLKVTHYRGGKYTAALGKVESVDFTLRFMKLDGQRIWFDDICSLSEVTDFSQINGLEKNTSNGWD